MHGYQEKCLSFRSTRQIVFAGKLEKQVTGEYTINRKLRKLRHGMNNHLQAC